MYRKRIISSAAALLGCGLVLALAPGAGASSPKVTIRIEGVNKTLLKTTTETVGSGSVTKGGAPRGACPVASAAGVLQKATKGRWSGSYSSTYRDYLITSILGETPNAKHAYWEILVDNVAASTGACEIKLHAGEQIVFATVSLSAKGYPLAVKAPAHASAGHAFTVSVVSYDAKGRAKPLAGATVTGAGASATTNARGVATLTDANAGTVTVNAAKSGYVRAAAVKVHVTS